jgi:hypothetical protein
MSGASATGARWSAVDKPLKTLITKPAPAALPANMSVAVSPTIARRLAATHRFRAMASITRDASSGYQDTCAVLPNFGTVPKPRNLINCP